MKIALLTLALLGSTSVAITGDEVARSKDGTLTLSLLPRALVREEVQGCSCDFYVPKRSAGASSSVIAWEFGAEKHVPIQINGATRRLKLISEIAPGKNGSDKELRKGDRDVFTLAGDRTKAVIDCKATATCAENPSESCEATFYQCKVTVDADGKRVAVGVEGACGC